MKGVFGNASAVSIAGNEKLCGRLPQFHLPTCEIKKSKRTGLTSRVRNIIICSAAGLLGTALLVLFLYMWFRKERKEIASIESVNKLMNVSYHSLFKATNGFSSANLIGAGSFGSVFQGVLGPEQAIVAIKVLDLTHHRASTSFTAECEALRNIMHRNLVKILTACSSLDSRGNDFKALVYEFMANGSLDEWLHPRVGTDQVHKEPRRQLGLLELLNIAIDVACALDYLHHQGETPIIHCDLKPSNILLDGQMVGRVGDFGLARVLPEAAQELIMSSLIGVKGSFGYIAPEYGAGGEVSALGDVYSYGILVLEMFTGKRPTDEMFGDGMNLYSFAKAALPGHVSQIVDPFLLQDGQGSEDHGNSTSDRIEQCLVSIIGMGVACSSESPRDCMNTGSVVTAMQVVWDKFLQSGY